MDKATSNHYKDDHISSARLPSIDDMVHKKRSKFFNNANFDRFYSKPGIGSRFFSEKKLKPVLSDYHEDNPVHRIK